MLRYYEKKIILKANNLDITFNHKSKDLKQNITINYIKSMWSIVIYVILQMHQNKVKINMVALCVIWIPYWQGL